MKQKVLSILALLLMAATGAMAQTTYTVVGSNAAMFGSAWDPSSNANDMTKNGDGTYSITYTNVNFTKTEEVQYKVVKDHSWGEVYPYFNRVINIAKPGTYTITIHFNPTTQEVYETIPYTVTLAEGTEDAGNWTITPKQGLSEGDQVTITYSGSKRVKEVKAVKKAPAGPGVTTFSELQTALSAGKDVKLMNDIVCTAEIEITSGALTIDGNGKTLSTTSAIRAFKVGSSATVAFKNLTLTGFVSGGGPAINNSGTIVLDGCTISNCHVNNSNGGGAIESSGKLYAINTTFSGNYSGEIGGAINNYTGSLYMSGCTFTNNYTTKPNAYYGGAIGINMGSEVRLINCSFSGNNYGTTAGPNDIGVYNKPTNYTIAGCTGVAIASRNGDITTNTTGTATLDYSDLSNISFTYTAEGAATARTLAEATAEDLGKIAGADGNIYDTKAAASTAGTTAVAMIAYVGSSTGHPTYTHGLAIALADESSSNLSTAKSTCEGKSAVTNAAWLLPSLNQWMAMFKAFGGNEGSYSGLNTAITKAGGTALKEGEYPYWSSTPYGEEDYGWTMILQFGDATPYDDEVQYEDRVRACLAF